MHDWREHPRLAGRFHPEHPDDLQVVVHDGGPRLTTAVPEAVWVRVSGREGDVFRGRVLNPPHQLRSVQLGSEIRFVATGGEHPVLVTDAYLRERGDWVVHPCPKCGLDELFDPPSDLIRVVFPEHPPGARMEMFTTFCPLCGGIQGVEARDRATPVAAPPAAPRRPWWRLWG